jgi:8-oxo-dGTP diphosphatase
MLSSAVLRSRVRVAVGVVCNQRGAVLVARRHAHLHQGGLWEFPGGKVDDGEPVYDALCRELLEEVGITVLRAEPLLTIEHDYSDKQVLLEVWRVLAFRGVPLGREGQPLRWLAVEELLPAEFPAANVAIIEALQGSVAQPC